MENVIQASGFVVQPRLQFNCLRDQMIYQYLLSRANYQENHKSLAVGQTVIILSDLERDVGWTRRMLKSSLERLEEADYISFATLPQKRGILVTVSHYGDYQKLENYRKSSLKNVQENEHQNVHEDEQENVQENESEKPCGSRGEDMPKKENVQENVQQDAQEDVHENEQLISITAFINSISNINKTLKEYVASAPVKNKNLTTTEEIETFVDFALRTNALPDGCSRKIFIAYFDCIRLTRRTCTISANILVNFIDKLQKYSSDQINYSLWKHIEDYDDRKETYTLGILRNVKEPEARRGLIKLKNRKGGDRVVASVESKPNEEIQKYDFGF